MGRVVEERQWVELVPLSQQGLGGHVILLESLACQYTSQAIGSQNHFTRALAGRLCSQQVLSRDTMDGWVLPHINAGTHRAITMYEEVK